MCVCVCAKAAVKGDTQGLLEPFKVVAGCVQVARWGEPATVHAPAMLESTTSAAIKKYIEINKLKKNIYIYIEYTSFLFLYRSRITHTQTLIDESCSWI